MRSFSFPGSTPVCDGFFPGRTCADNYPRSSWKKKQPHTGVDPGKLSERTHCLTTHTYLCTTEVFLSWLLLFTHPFFSLANFLVYFFVALKERSICLQFPHYFNLKFDLNEQALQRCCL